MINKKVIYTCIVGNYDSLKEPKVISEGYDYICFTDNLNLKSKTWQILPIPEDIKDFNNTKINRYIKWFPQKLLKEYDFSIYVDGTMTQIGDLNDFTEKYCNDDNICLYLIKHNKRSCIYAEFLANAYARHKTSLQSLYDQMTKYIKEGMPFDFMLTHNCILFRKHNDEIYNIISEALWQEMTEFEMRDQLVLPYIIWLLSDVVKDKIKLIDNTIIGAYFDYEKSWLHDLKYNKERGFLKSVLRKIYKNKILNEDDFVRLYQLLNLMFKEYM